MRVIQFSLNRLCAFSFLISVLFPLKHLTAQPKKNVVSGIVLNANKEPLGGVSVVIKDSKNNFIVGTSTDNFGAFSFSNVSLGGPYNLAFSIVGYETQTLLGYTLRDGSPLRLSITMKETVASLDQVVVVGYGTTKRKDLTGAVSSVKSKEIEDLAVTRIDQALLGKVAGVQVKPVSGEPGASPQIRVRGIGSISAGASPLYVVDGFPTGSIETLNPNDIESLDILKDASATAIYGSRGSNGVIIINTKRGKAGKTNISFDTYYGWQKVSKKPEMMNAKQQAQYFYDGIRNRNIDEGNNVSASPDTWVRPVPAIILDVLAGRNTYDVNALDAVLVTAPQNQYQLTASGGNENVRFALSGEYLNQDGIVLNTHFKRYSLRANIDAKLNKRLSVKVNINPSLTDKTALPVTGNQGENILGSAISVSNFYPLLDSTGNYFIFAGLPAQADFSNPLAIAREYISNQKGMRLLGNVETEYKLSDQLAFRVMLGGSYIGSKGMTFKPQLPVFSNNPATGSDNASVSYNWLTEYTLNYNKSFGKHQIAALGGFTAQKERGDLNSLTSNKYPNNLVPTLSAVSGVITNGTSDTYQWSMVSYLGRVNYNYSSKYYLTASFRTDGSSRFGTEKKYGVFPSAALAWRISSEKFLQKIHFINEMKLRGSYGETGNNNIGNYEQYATINYNKYAFGGIAIGGFAPGRLANPLLTWETQKSFNVGLDASFLKNRVSISIDRFHSRNYNLLLNVNIPSITGFSSALKNIGEVKNAGWEFVLSTVNFNQKLKWSTDFNLSTFKNEVVKLGPEGDPIIAGDNITMIGQPIGMFYGFITDGIFKTQAELAQGPIFNPGAADRSRVGDIRFKDISGPNGKPDGIISSFDNTIMGSPYPDFYYGMTNRFSFKNFGLSVSLQGSYGNDVLNSSFSSGSATRARVRVYAYNNNYWKSEQDPGDGLTPRPNDAPTGGVRLTSQRFLDNGSYLRVNNVTLDYVLPSNVSQRLRLSTMRIYIGATNPFLFTKYKKYNPDVSLNDDPLRPGVESNDYPLPKTLLVGLNLNF
jgi:TonB-linked SusC/RagA family outer membrane protein